MFSSLKIKNYRIYWSGAFVSLIGTWVQTTALSWLVFQLTNSAFLLGVVGFLGAFPIFLLSLFGGVYADRMNKKNILIFTQSTFMVLAFLLAFMTQIKLITTLQIMLIAVLNGIIMAFDAPSRQAMVVDMVGKSKLLNAIAWNSVAFNSSRIIGPALAGILIANIGMSGCFYLNGISFLAVIIALGLIKIEGNSKRGKDHALKELKDGLRFIKNNRIILLLVAIVGISSLFGFSYLILMPIVSENIFHAGVKGLGVLMSSAGVGALIGALMLAGLGDFKYKGKFLFMACLVFSGCLVLFGLSHSYLFSILILVIMGWSSISVTALINTLLQTLSPDEYRGRLMSAFMFTFAGFMPFGNLIAGSLAQAFGVSLAIVANGVICGAAFIMINIFYPEVRELK